MSETTPKQPSKSPATPAIESPKPNDELAAEELDKVAGGMKPDVRGPKKGGDPCDGGE